MSDSVNYAHVLEPGVHVERSDKGEVKKISYIGDAAHGMAIGVASHILEALGRDLVNSVMVTGTSRPVLQAALRAYVEAMAAQAEAERKSRATTTGVWSYDGAGTYSEVRVTPVVTPPKADPAPPATRRSKPPASRPSRPDTRQRGGK